MTIYKLGDILIEFSKKNVDNHPAVAIGKFGLRLRQEIYKSSLTKDYQNNKVISQNTFVIGMGVKEIDHGVLIKDNLFSVSPAYKTFDINKSICKIEYFDFLFKFIKPKISKKFMILSARQGKTTDIKGLLNYHINVHSKERQDLIIKTLTSIESLEILTKRDLEFIKEKKSALLNKIFNDQKMFDNGNYNFNEIFEKITNKNINKYDQYTIGKRGINKIESTSYNIENHISFTKNNLIIGIGIEEINVNINILNGCCSPIYNIYKINLEKIYPEFSKWYIPWYLIKNKNKICKKSQRREYEIISKDLNKLQINLPTMKEQIKIGNLFYKINKHMEKTNKTLKLQKEQKEALLEKIFKNIDN